MIHINSYDHIKIDIDVLRICVQKFFLFPFLQYIMYRVKNGNLLRTTLRARITNPRDREAIKKNINSKFKNMPYSVGQKVIYNSIGGKKVDATIIAKKDPGTGTIKTENASGNFDYLVSVEKDGKKEEYFCSENDIK